MSQVPFDVTFPVFNERHAAVGIVLLAYLDSQDDDKQIALVVQVEDGWELWTMDMFVGRICLWQDRQNNMIPIEELIRDWLQHNTVEQPQVRYVDRNAQVFVPSPQQIAQLVATRACPFDDPSMADSMRRWLDTRNFMSEWFAANNDTLTPVTVESYSRLKVQMAAQIRKCDQCRCSCVSMCQDASHVLCAEHFGQYVQHHARLLTLGPHLKMLPSCLCGDKDDTCDAPVCLDMLFQVASRLQATNEAFDAIIDIAGAINSS